MSRRNLYLVLAFGIVALACYVQVGSTRRDAYGRVLLDTMQEIHNHYLEDVTDRELFEAAMAGMAGRLDEYSQYLGPESFREFNENIEHRFGGIGIQVVVDRETNVLTVVTPLVGTPAYAAGILAGDRIVEIDGESTEGYSIEDAVKRMRGEIGAPVQLKILHPDTKEPVEYKLTREQINVDTVLGDLRHPNGSWDFFLEGHPGIGYIRLVSFSERTVEDLKKALDWLVEHKMKGLILDLRGNPGGLLESAVQVSDLFLDEGRIVTTRDRDGIDRQVFEAEREGTYRGFPMAVLVNFGSASASEIVAAALQDHGRAVVIGERTYGKGSVQNVIPLEGGSSALKLTIASYWRPSGQNIHRGRKATEEDQWGVLPNDGYEVKFEEEELRDVMRARRQRDVVRTPGASGLPPEEAVESEAASEKPVSKSEKSAGDTAASASADEKDETGTGSEEAADEPKGPAVDKQLEKAIEYLDARLREPEIKAA
ncbi:MAG: S41 family peptidase [Pirellulales bacterium]|nr:S41 family peptidase [Pirellulales bacterium]